MEKVLWKNKILVVLVVFFGFILFCKNVKAATADSECYIYEYKGGVGVCTETDPDIYHTESQIGESGIFNKGDCLWKTAGPLEIITPLMTCTMEAEDAGHRLANGNCMENINYCYNIFLQQDVITWDGDDKTEITPGGSKNTVDIKVKSSKETVNKISCFTESSLITCSEGRTDGTIITVDKTIGEGEYKIKVIGFTDKQHVSIKKVTIKINSFNCEDFNSLQCKENTNCFFSNGDNKCHNKQDNSVCNKLSKDVCGTAGGSEVCVWSEIKSECITNLSSSVENRYKKPNDYKGPLPDCAFDGSCKDVNKLLELAINVGEMLFGVIGSLAFVFFIYGGFTMILSFGSAEKFKKGQQILIAAVIGMVIAFGAYALVGFLMTSLGVSSSLIFIK